MFLIILFSTAIILSSGLTSLVRFFAVKLNIQDYPASPRKNHSLPTPLLGGVAIFLAVLGSLILLFWWNRHLVQSCKLVGEVTSCGTASGWSIVGGILLGAFILTIGGILDDKYNLKPRQQIIWPILAIATVILAGVGQDNITNPLYYVGLSADPLLHLKVWTIHLFGLEITMLTDLFTFIWLFLLIYVTKFLDGLNGLVPGIIVIGALILFVTSLSLGQTLPAVLSLIVAGAYLGFLPFNFFGKIFLGEAGSTLAGFLIGVLAILGPAKISITFLILGIPILDACWVIYERLVKAGKSPFQGDTRHLHFKLLKQGLTSRQTVLLLWLISLLFGLLGIFLQGWEQGILWLALVALMAILIRLTRSPKPKSQNFA